MNKIIFIGGVHGVGKTYFCSNILHKFNLNFYSASDLISKMKNKQFNTSKRVENIYNNQEILIAAISELIVTDKLFFLDGHFCLLDKNGDIKKVPEETFRDLSLKAIIVLEDSVEKIMSRLENRDKISYSKEYLKRFQEEELKHSLEIAKSLNVPYLVFSYSEDPIKVFDFVERILK